MEPTMPERDPVDDEDAWMFPPLRQPSTGELRKLRDDLIKAMEGRHEVRILPSRPDGGTVHTNPVTETAHFPGCHPEDAEDTRQTPSPIPETEPCWHCGTPTTRGTCGCADCWEGDDYVPVSSVYHCPTCKRWWAYMIPRITEITFNSEEER